MDTFIYIISWLIIYVGIPFWFILAPVFSKRFSFIPNRTIGKGILLSTLIMWPLMLGYRISIEVPYNMARTDDPVYDGVGGNAAILMFGWLMALIFQVPNIVLRLLVDFIAKRQRKDSSFALKMTRPNEITLDVSGIYDAETLHEYLSKTLNFPGFYGFNFNALWDCIADDDQSIMPSHLIVTGMLDLKTQCPEVHAGLVDCLREYAMKFPARRLTLQEGDAISPALTGD